MPAPPPMQMTPLQFSSSQTPGIGQQMQALGKNLAGAKAALQPTQVPNVGMPGSPAEGPLAPGAPAMVPPAAIGQPAPGGAPPGGAPGGPQLGQYIMQNMNPVSVMDWLKRTAGLGPMQPGMPGTAATTAAGMLSPTMNNPSQYGGY